MSDKGEHSSRLAKPLSALVVPGMYLFYKYNEYKRHQEEINRRNVTEKELDNLNNKIVSFDNMIYVVKLRVLMNSLLFCFPVSCYAPIICNHCPPPPPTTYGE